jgi:hypothetical protein
MTREQDISARRANVREAILAARVEPEFLRLWRKCIKSALIEYRCAQASQ